MATQILNSNKYGPATENDIAEFEQLIKARLPEDYRAFLLEHNGGVLDPSFFFISEEQGSDGLITFHSLAKEPKNDSLYWYFEWYFGWKPSNIIFIGSDPGGNNICISVSGSDYGSIYLWFHHNVADYVGETGYDNLYLVAESFSEFINNLYEPSEEEE